MLLRSQGFLPWALVWLLAGAAGAAWLARGELAQQRELFETNARIAHRLLSQVAVQHDAILATLALLQPAADAEARERRLASVYPQVLGVLRRDREAAWPDAALSSAEAASRQAQRAALAGVDFAQGQFSIVQAAEPASFALRIDVQRMTPWSEWPMATDGPVRATLEYAGQTRVLHPGQQSDGAWRLDFRKHLAADSQPFDLVVSQPFGWRALPWGAMLAWLLALAGVLAALAALQRQRSERRRAEALLRLGQVARLNALGELAAGMAHELNQPLAALLAGTQAAARMLDDDPPELPGARAAMAHAASQARRASDVLNRLRHLVEQPGRGSATQALRLEDSVRKVLYLLDPECTRRAVVPRIEASSPGVTVMADPVALEQVVHNLVMNALQALEQVPAAERQLTLAISQDITQDTTQERRQAVLAVRDSGPGIAPEQLPHVFEPFFSTREGGMGLGLSLCETLAAGLGGSLACRNLAPRGTEFRLVLPLVVQ